MGRPAKFNRDDAVKIAMHTFWEKGYETTSVSELSARMSITRSSFYNSFVSREALFEEVIALYKKQSADAFLDELDLAAGQPVLPVFRKILMNLVKVRIADTDAKGCLVANGMANTDENCEVAHVFREIMNARVERYTELLDMAVKNGELAKETDTTTTARTFVAHMIGINMVSKITDTSEQLYAVAETMLNGLGLSGTTLQ